MTVIDTDSVFILDNCEQMDITQAQADALVEADLIYQAEPDVNPYYYTLHWDGSFEAVEAFLAGQS